jgi:hypothetical protein
VNAVAQARQSCRHSATKKAAWAQLGRCEFHFYSEGSYSVIY